MTASCHEAKIKIEQLVERFARNLDVYKRAEYKEAHVRVEFIDPLFEALGWDVRNVQGYAEQYKDVVHEDALKVSGATRAPDYCFRVGGVRKFFLEAKKPSVSVKGDVGPAYQLRRYAWSAKLPLSILTDFEEFAVYDCRQRPRPSDKASVGRVRYLTFDGYLDRFDDVFGVFAKESVLKGSFDRYVQEARRKRGTGEVDAEFLKEIEGWRETLARNIALRNPALSVHELNFAVQRTIDRVIFLRMCEDRGIEEYGRLLALTAPTQPTPTGGGQGGGIYPRLGDLYRQADEKYNAGLFDFQADTLTTTLTVDDRVLKPILASLYYPQCPYEFSVLPADVLGQVYEQFLGQVIRLTPGHRAKVEEKPEVKKAGGVYYTPTYIVDYIVQQTVGQLVEGKTPRQIAGVGRVGNSPLRILDPACGSGSFLLGAYQYLLDYHRRWYEAHDPAKHARGKRPAVYQGPRGEWRLTTAEKKRILLDNIYGVDIDRQAVEVTKLSLLLKVLEGENQETLGRQLALWRERALPDLGNNIKCGNSLIGPDYFEAQLLPLENEEEMRRVNPFDWESEFPEVIAAGGFDAVIGNPPYVLGRETFDNRIKEYISTHYDAYRGKYDLYIYFTEKAISLLRKQGRLGYILPNTLLANVNATRLREMILDRTSIKIIKTFRSKVFRKAQVESIILVTQNEQNNGKNTILIEAEKTSHIPQSLFRKSEDFRFNIYTDPGTETLIEKIRSISLPLGDLSDICIGIQLGGSAGSATKKSFLSDTKKDATHKKVLDGRYIDRYQRLWKGIYVRYGDWLHRKRNEKYFLNPKIVIRQIGKIPIATHDEEQFYTLNTIYNVINSSDYSLKYFLGIINSKLGGWFWIKRNYDFKTLFGSTTFNRGGQVGRVSYPPSCGRYGNRLYILYLPKRGYGVLTATTLWWDATPCFQRLRNHKLWSPQFAPSTLTTPRTSLSTKKWSRWWSRCWHCTKSWPPPPSPPTRNSTSAKSRPPTGRLMRWCTSCMG